MTTADFILPYLLGVLTVVGPQVYLYIRGLRRQIAFISPGIPEDKDNG